MLCTPADETRPSRPTVPFRYGTARAVEIQCSISSGADCFKPCSQEESPVPVSKQQQHNSLYVFHITFDRVLLSRPPDTRVSRAAGNFTVEEKSCISLFLHTHSKGGVLLSRPPDTRVSRAAENFTTVSAGFFSVLYNYFTHASI